jgi:hypothetical protein
MSTLPPAPPAPGPPPWPQVAPSRPQRWPVVASLVIALVAVGLAIGSWLRPLPSAKAPSTPAYTNQQTADAKGKVCVAFGQVDHALDVADAQGASNGDPTSHLATAALGREVLDFGHRYLLAKLVEEPATPPDLASAVRQQANAFLELFIGYIDGIPTSDSRLQPAQNASDEAALTIRRLCK